MRDACQDAVSKAFSLLTKPSPGPTAFNPLNWRREAPTALVVPVGHRLAEYACQADIDSAAVLWCLPGLPSTGLTSLRLEAGPPDRPKGDSAPGSDRNTVLSCAA